MTDTIDTLLQDDPDKWVGELPEFQRSAIQELRSAGSSYEDIAQAWITASAENTYRFSASAPVGDKGHSWITCARRSALFFAGTRNIRRKGMGFSAKRVLPVHT